MASLMASLSAVGSRSRVAGGLPQPGRGLVRARAAWARSRTFCMRMLVLYSAEYSVLRRVRQQRQKPAVPSTPTRPHVHPIYSQANGSFVQS